MSKSKEASRFNDELIVRDDLPRDAFLLIHDLAYDHEGRERFQYRSRAQQLLMTSDIPPRIWPKRYISAVKDGSAYCMSCGKNKAKRKDKSPAPIRLIAGPIYASLCMTCAKQISNRLDVIIAAIEERYGKL